MAEPTVYLKMDTKVKTEADVICISDLGKIYCQDTYFRKRIRGDV